MSTDEQESADADVQKLCHDLFKRNFCTHIQVIP